MKPLSEVFEDQIACADLILLTKADLASSSDKEKAKRVIANTNGHPHYRGGGRANRP